MRPSSITNHNRRNGVPCSLPRAIPYNSPTAKIQSRVESPLWLRLWPALFGTFLVGYQALRMMRNRFDAIRETFQDDEKL